MFSFITADCRQKLILTAIALVFLLAGCANDSQMREQQALYQRLSTVEQQQRALKESQQKLNADTNIRLDNLERELKLLSESVEDSLTKPEEIGASTANPEIDAALTRIEERLQKLEQQVNGNGTAGNQPTSTSKTPPATARATPTPVKATPPGAREKALYDDAYAAFKRGNFKAAKNKFKKFIATYPNSTYKVNALFWIGECYYKSRDYAEAIIKYDAIVASYPHHPKAPSALLKQGFAFIQLGDTTDGKLILEKVVKNYPGTDQAEIAKRKLKILK